MTKYVEYDLKAFRDELDISQEEIAHELGVVTQTWRRHEKSGKVPSLWVAWLDGRREKQPTREEYRGYMKEMEAKERT